MPERSRQTRPNCPAFHSMRSGSTMLEKNDPVLFALPIVLLQARLRFERPWTLGGTLSANPVTTLRGAFGQAVAGTSAWGGLDPWLRKTPSRFHPDQILPRLLFRVEVSPDPQSWDLRVLLRGDGAEQLCDLVEAALRETGRVGLLHGGDPRRFLVESPRITVDATHAHLDGVVAGWPTRLGRVIVEFVTPCRAGSFEPRELAGNLACSLVKLARATSADASVTQVLIDAEADAARDVAREAFVDVRVAHEVLRSEEGKRVSGETGHVIPMQGKHGFLALEGKFDAAKRWLALMELHGVGGNTAFGAGAIRLSFRS